MKVRVDDLDFEAKHVEFREEGDALNAALDQGGRWLDQRFADGLDCALELYRSGTDVHLSGRLSGRLACECVRCLEPFERRVERELVFVIVKAMAEDPDRDDVGYDHYDGDEIDLGPLVREQALLALDSVALCSVDCKGLCAGCGANLNDGGCACEGN